MHLHDFLNALSPRKAGEWVRENMPRLLKARAKIKVDANRLLHDIENFIEESNLGIYVF